MQSFMGRVLADMSGAMLGLMGIVGDRLGLFGRLAAEPATAEELAQRAGIDDRYAREWLHALTCAGYVEHDPDTGRYSLPPEHAMVIAAEGAPTFLGGGYEQLAGFAGAIDRVIAAMSAGGGVSQAQYGSEMHRGMERMSAPWFDHQLVPEWIASIDGVEDRLLEGGLAADIGCGSGRALVALATAFPHVRLTGYDVFGPALARAQDNLRAAGVADRVELVLGDAADGLQGPFDLVTTFDMLHDAARPEQIAAAVRRSLSSDGVWLLVEIAAGETVEDNIGPAGTILYSTSVLFCTPTSIASGAEGLGTMGMPESSVRRLCADAGFAGVERLPVPSPFNAVYVARP